MKLLARLFLICSVLSLSFSLSAQALETPPHREELGDYIIIGWNDLGMHCMNGDFSQLVVLPPYNNLWCQVIKRGKTPELVGSDMVLEYRFPENTTSSNKINFWENVEALFGVSLPDDVGLTGNGLSGFLTWNGTAWEATGIPLTPFTDANPDVEQPYQLAEVTLKTSSGSEVLDRAQVVAPVSTEMHCDLCHNGTEDKSSAEAIENWKNRIRKDLNYRSIRDEVTLSERNAAEILAAQDILREHDKVDGVSLMDMRPVLCAECHSSNALGTAGRPGVKSLSQSIHEKHGEEFPDLNCYSCHPGQQAQCLRGAMFQAGQSCVDCHGTIMQVAKSIDEGRRPWIDEPKCGSCHQGYEENPNTLYRNSIGHGGLYCAACHGSPHAEYPTVQPRDNYQPLRLQGAAKTLFDCMICHTEKPTEPGPHGIMAGSMTQWNLY